MGGLPTRAQGARLMVLIRENDDANLSTNDTHRNYAFMDVWADREISVLQ